MTLTGHRGRHRLKYITQSQQLREFSVRYNATNNINAAIDEKNAGDFLHDAD
jgi:hypothetical protein